MEILVWCERKMEMEKKIKIKKYYGLQRGNGAPIKRTRNRKRGTARDREGLLERTASVLENKDKEIGVEGLNDMIEQDYGLISSLLFEFINETFFLEFLFPASKCPYDTNSTSRTIPSFHPILRYLWIGPLPPHTYLLVPAL